MVMVAEDRMILTPYPGFYAPVTSKNKPKTEVQNPRYPYPLAFPEHFFNMGAPPMGLTPMYLPMIPESYISSMPRGNPFQTLLPTTDPRPLVKRELPVSSPSPSMVDLTLENTDETQEKRKKKKKKRHHRQKHNRKHRQTTEKTSNEDHYIIETENSDLKVRIQTRNLQRPQESSGNTSARRYIESPSTVVENSECDTEWRWLDRPTRRRNGLSWYKSITRNGEVISVGECAVFVTEGCLPPYVGKVLRFWQNARGAKKVQVSWFYRPNDIQSPEDLPIPTAALFASAHADENNLRTISHKCQVLPWHEYVSRISQETSVEANTLFFMAGKYDMVTQQVRLDPNINQAL